MPVLAMARRNRTSSRRLRYQVIRSVGAEAAGGVPVDRGGVPVKEHREALWSALGLGDDGSVGLVSIA
jgi:hypothetical protein